MSAEVVAVLESSQLTHFSVNIPIVDEYKDIAIVYYYNVCLDILTFLDSIKCQVFIHRSARICWVSSLYKHCTLSADEVINHRKVFPLRIFNRLL